MIALIAASAAVEVQAAGSIGGSIGESAGQMVYEWRSAE